MCETLLYDWTYTADTHITLFAILAVAFLIVRADKKDGLSKFDPAAALVVNFSKVLGVSIVAIMLTLRYFAITC